MTAILIYTLLSLLACSALLLRLAWAVIRDLADRVGRLEGRLDALLEAAEGCRRWPGRYRPTEEARR